MKTFNKTRIIWTFVLVALLVVSAIGAVVLAEPAKADAAEVTTEVSYVFDVTAGYISGEHYYAEQYQNAQEIGFSLNTSDINNPYFDVYAFTYFYDCDFISVYLWLEGTTGPTTSTSARDASSLSNVGEVSFFDDMTYSEGKIYLSDLATLPDNYPVGVYFGMVAVGNNGEDNTWEDLLKVGTITKYVTTKQPLPVAPTKTGYVFTGWYTDQACTQKYELDYITGNVTLYAGFSPIEYYIAFNANSVFADDYGSVTGSMDEYPVDYDDDFVFPECGFTAKGFRFTGWQYEDSQEVYQPGDEVSNLSTVDQDTVTFYALWDELDYTVSFDLNGGSGSMANETHVGGVAKTLATYSGTKTGYTFEGWSVVDGDSQPDYTNGQSVTLSQTDTNITLHAVWSPNSYTITFDGNKFDYPNVSGSTASLSMTYDVAKNLPSCGFTNTGYKFLGWDTDSRAQEPRYTAGQSVKNLVSTSDGFVHLYAIWAEVNYNVAFNANGGSGTMANQQMQVGIAEALNANTFTRTGYTFSGWAESATGARVYSDKQSVTSLESEGKTKTLYAVWAPNTYTIHFDGNKSDYPNVTGTTASLSMTYDVAKNLPSCGFTNNGYTFVGWDTDSRAQDPRYVAGQSVSNLVSSNGGSVILSAIWKANSYTVTFDANGGTTPTASKSVTYDNIYGTLPVATKTGYSLKGWFTAKTGGTQVTADTEVTITSAQTLYAQWTANTYTVKFNSQGGSTVADKTVTYDSTYGTLSTPTRDGYKFLGWFTATSGGTQVTADTKVAITATQTLYAHWQANTYTVVFNGNGNTGGSTATQTLTYDKAEALTANGFTKTGYHFVGWATSASGSKVYSDKQSVTNVAGTNASVTLYAIWEANDYTVVFNTNGGTGSVESQTMTYDKVEYLNKGTLTRDGHVFRGWSTTQGGKIEYVAGAPVENLTTTNDGTVTLYAVWEKIQCTVTFIVDGEIYAVVTVEWGTPSEEVIGQAVNSMLYEPEGDLPNA